MQVIAFDWQRHFITNQAIWPCWLQTICPLFQNDTMFARYPVQRFKHIRQACGIRKVSIERIQLSRRRFALATCSRSPCLLAFIF